MFVLFEITDLAAIELFISGIPESVGLLVFGIGLVVVAISIRRFLGRGDTNENGEKLTKKV